MSRSRQGMFRVVPWGLTLLLWSSAGTAGESGHVVAIAVDHPVWFSLWLVGAFAMILTGSLLWRRGRRLRRVNHQLEQVLIERDRLVGQLPVGLYTLIDEGGEGPRVKTISDRALDLLGVSRQEVMRAAYAAFDNLHPADRERVIEQNENARQTVQPFRVEARYLVEGRQRWLRIESRPRRFEDHIEWYGYIIDVTDRHEAESRFKMLFEQSPLAIMLHDVETGGVLDANRAAWEAYGLDSLVALQQRDLWAEPPYSEAEALTRIRAAAQGRVERFEWYSINAQGEPFWELVSLMPVVIEGRLRVFSTAIDITQLREAQQRLQESERVLNTMSGLANVGGWDVDLVTNRLQWTDQTFRIHELPVGERLDVIDALSFYHPDDRQKLEQALESARDQAVPYDLTLRMTTAKGRKIVARSICHPIEQGGRVVRLVGAFQDVTETVSRERKLEEAERRFRAIFEQSPVAVLVQDAYTGEVLDANRQTWRNYGFSDLAEFKAAMQDGRLSLEPGSQKGLMKMREAVAKGGDRVEWPTRHADGHTLWFEVTLTPVELGGRACVLAVCVDVTERRESARRLEESETRFRRILQDVDGVAVQGYRMDGSVIYWNRASEVLYGYTEAEARKSTLFDLIIPEPMRDEVRANVAAVDEGGDIPNGELELVRKDGSLVPVYSSHTVLRSPDAEPELFCVDIDLTERKAHERALDRMANYDSLTGLPNRRLMADLLEQMMARVQRNQTTFALCYLDLDDFKPINDRFGHGVGDQVLVAIAQRLRRLVRGSDLVARLGGDEFVVALDGIGEGPELDRRLNFLLEGVARPVEVERLELQVHASVGVTLYPTDSGDPDALLRHADQAMYRAKSQGRNQYSLFDVELEANVQRRRERLSEIEHGLNEGQFRLYYQPKIDLASGRAASFEGLVRWHRPDGEVLSPMTFLPALDRSDLEVRFGETMIGQALAQMSAWKTAGHDVCVSVNVAGPHLLSAGFVDALKDLLGRHPDCPPEHLALEIVESAAVNDLKRAIAVLTEVRALGIQISLDDFGTGYSSLSHLRSLPVDEVKVDQSFVRDMLDDINDRNIVQSVVSLADAFSLRAVAEGVETQAHIEALRELGCELGQGYAFARPMPAEAVAAWLVDQSSTSS